MVPDFAYILRLVSRFLPSYLDRESLAAEITFDCWNRQIPATYTLIRNRCFDVIRRYHREQLANEIRQQLGTKQDEEAQARERTDLVNKIMLEANLTPRERELIFLRIYQDQTFIQIAEINHLSLHEVTETYRIAVQKLKDFVSREERET